jgi:mono/diheme cytochrome c family protein
MISWLRKRAKASRWRTLPVISALSMLLLGGCRRDMQDQPKYLPLQASRFFADGRSARPIPAGTIARGHLNDTDAFHTGAVNGVFLDTIPAALNQQLLKRGEQRFDIYCSPCHGILGDGNGMVARRGFKIPANFHTDRLRKAPPGYLFQVISNGYGAMPNYDSQIRAEDRWAIVAYIRALQLSRNAAVADVPADERSKLGLQ